MSPCEAPVPLAAAVAVEIEQPREVKPGAIGFVPETWAGDGQGNMQLGCGRHVDGQPSWRLRSMPGPARTALGAMATLPRYARDAYNAASDQHIGARLPTHHGCFACKRALGEGNLCGSTSSERWQTA